MIYVRTCAYNAEKTIERAVESILNQTHEEFIYYILDNGSTDGTGEIIRRYAQQDKRIVPFYNKRNHDTTENVAFWELFYTLEEGDYLCLLDADDAYDVTFLEEALRFLKENHLDIAMCGTVFMDADTWTPFGERVVSRNLVLKDAAEFELCFPEMYWNLRAMWGKLYSAKAARFPYTSAVGLPDWYPSAYGGDTVNVFGSLEMVECVGVLAKPLHYYAVSKKSVSHHWLEGREKSDPILFQRAEELLKKKCGRVSEPNYRMLYAVYFHAVSDTYRVLFESDLAAEKKLELAHTIFFHPITQKMFTTQFNVPNEERVDFFVYVVIKLLSLWDERKETSYGRLAEIFSNINPDFSQLLTKESFSWLMECCPVVVRNVVLREYEYAVNNLMVYLSKCETAPAVEYPYVLGQVLSALREEEKKYLYFSKKLIWWCIVNGQTERAERELKDWLAILPEDENLKELQRMLKGGAQ